MGGVARNGVPCRPIGLAAFGTSRDLLAARVTSHFSQFPVVSRSLSRSRTALYRAEILFDVNEPFFEKFRRDILLRWSLRFEMIFEVRRYIVEWFYHLEWDYWIKKYDLYGNLIFLDFIFDYNYGIWIVQGIVICKNGMWRKRRISFVGLAGIIRLVSFLFERFARNWRKLESGWVVWEF